MTVQNTWMTLFMAHLDRDLPSILLRSCYIVLCQNRIVLCKKDPATSGKSSHPSDRP